MKRNNELEMNRKEGKHNLRMCHWMFQTVISFCACQIIDRKVQQKERITFNLWSRQKQVVDLSFLFSPSYFHVLKLFCLWKLLFIEYSSSYYVQSHRVTLSLLCRTLPSTKPSLKEKTRLCISLQFGSGHSSSQLKIKPSLTTPCM